MITLGIVLCALFMSMQAVEQPAPETKVTRSKAKKSTKSFALPIGKLWVDPTAWHKSTESNVPGATLELAHDEGDAFLAVITSPDFIPANDFIVAFVEGMASGDSEVKNATLSKRRSLTVNGTQLTDITITAIVSHQPFVYRGYLYTGRKGLCLILTWTHADLYSELVGDIEQALDGYVAK